MLHGERLAGRFVIVRTAVGRALSTPTTGRTSGCSSTSADATADPGWDIDAFPTSVLSGRTNDEVKAGVPALWDSSKPAAEARIDLSGAVEAPLPDVRPARCSRPPWTARSATPTGCSR